MSIAAAFEVSFFHQFVTSGGPIVWIILLPLSVASISLAVYYFVTVKRRRLVPEGIGKKICSTFRINGMGRGLDLLSREDDLVSRASVRVFSQKHTQLSRESCRNLYIESLQENALELFRRIEWINIIGNIAPMVGLFGTVFGMIKAFNKIVEAGGQPGPDELAGGISVALVTTFWGLLVAIPSIAVYGVFRNRVESLVSEAALEVEEIIDNFEIEDLN
jgi:biopolymer transport protein ExbB